MTSQPRRPPVRGFMSRAREIVREHPGLTAQEVAKQALQADPHLSNARSPSFSLATTLEKQVRMGAEVDIEARRVNGATRYYPKGGIGQTGNSGGGGRPTAPTIATQDAPSGPNIIDLWIGSVHLSGPRTSETVKHVLQALETEQRRLANG